MIGDVRGLLTCPVCGSGFPAAGRPAAAGAALRERAQLRYRAAGLRQPAPGRRPAGHGRHGGDGGGPGGVPVRRALRAARGRGGRPRGRGLAPSLGAAHGPACSPSMVPFGSTILAIASPRPAQGPPGGADPARVARTARARRGRPGYYLAAVLDRIRGRPGGAEAAGLAMDISARALRRAARARPGIGAVGWDIWRPFPVRDGAVSLILNVFAPRNGPEFRRVLRDDGALIVVTPGAASPGRADRPGRAAGRRRAQGRAGRGRARRVSSPWRTRAT